MVKVAINGFGRIGRNAFKILLERHDVQVVAINDVTDAATLAHLLKYDSSYGIYSKKVTAGPKSLFVNTREVPVFAEKDPVMASKMVPECIYRGFCPELTCCGYVNTQKYKEKLEEYRKEAIESHK